MGSNDAVWPTSTTTPGRALVAAADSVCDDAGVRHLGNTILRRLTADGARDRLVFNLEIMTGRSDLDLGFTPDVPGSPGLLPSDPARVARVVSHLNVDATTARALRVLAGTLAASTR